MYLSTCRRFFFNAGLLKKKQLPKLFKKNSNIQILEIGPGSGIQLQTLLGIGVKKENIFSGDINPEVVKHCNKLGFQCIKSDLFENLPGKFDLIIFNPPYLPEDKKEPLISRTATTGGEIGSEIINKFLKQAKSHLKLNGKIFLLKSSLTKKINWKNYNKKIIGKKKLFFEELEIWELSKKKFF